MKKICVITLMLLTTGVFAEENPAEPFPDNVLDIPWGASRATAKVKMMGRTGVRVDHNYDDDLSTLVFHGGQFGGREVAQYKLDFYHGGLKSISIRFAANKLPNHPVYGIKPEYEKWVADLTSKYGPPKSVGKQTADWQWWLGDPKEMKYNMPTLDKPDSRLLIVDLVHGTESELDVEKGDKEVDYVKIVYFGPNGWLSDEVSKTKEY